MNLPKLLTGRPPEPALEILQSTSLTILGTLKAEELIAEMELQYGYEDLPVMDDLAALIAGAARFWHQELKIGIDIQVLQRGFIHAFLMGLETASQIHRADGPGIQLDTSLVGIFDGKRIAIVSAPLTNYAQDVVPRLENIFAIFQEQVLAAATSTRDQDLFYDFYACACLWTALAGVDSGLARFESVE